MSPARQDTAEVLYRMAGEEYEKALEGLVAARQRVIYEGQVAGLLDEADASKSSRLRAEKVADSAHDGSWEMDHPLTEALIRMAEAQATYDVVSRLFDDATALVTTEDDR